MVEVLEKIAKKSNSTGISGEKVYSGRGSYLNENVRRKENYSTFAEIYLEKPIDVQAGLSVTVCTWRGVPTIDDW